MSGNAPHPWTLHDPGETDAPARITADDGGEVTLQRAWREVQVLRARVEALEAERQAALDAVNIYGDEVLHSQLDAIGWPWTDGAA